MSLWKDGNWGSVNKEVKLFECPHWYWYFFVSFLFLFSILHDFFFSRRVQISTFAWLPLPRSPKLHIHPTLFRTERSFAPQLYRGALLKSIWGNSTIELIHLHSQTYPNFFICRERPGRGDRLCHTRFAQCFLPVFTKFSTRVSSTKCQKTF